MEPGNHPPPARIAGLKAALAAVGVVFFVLAVTLPARWAYAVGALLLLASVVAGRKPRQRTPHHPKHTSEHNDHPPRSE
ncbi:hypothetical protein ACFC0C_26520 [Streptomyces sp. NPDC056178]|uniref:hypothetical protein n=1 Tax=unclassified Streptomyces TaxID=2593676 RepID=UPI0035DD3904